MFSSFCWICGNCNAFADRKSTRLNSSHLVTSYAVFCLKKQTTTKSAYQLKIVFLRSKSPISLLIFVPGAANHLRLRDILPIVIALTDTLLPECSALDSH